MDDNNPNNLNDRNNPNSRKNPDAPNNSKGIGIIALAILALIILFFVFRTPAEVDRNAPASSNPNSTLNAPASNQTIDNPNQSGTTNTNSGNTKTTTP
ncbi:MAG: hypothetical protein H0U73_00475 [Tatlockia sp.]|nr:hypothetical protein [Tatlockia sp.]